MVVLRRCVSGLGALLSLLSPALAIKMLYDDSLPEDLDAACSAALMADVTCDPLVPSLRHDFYYPPATLTRVCTAGCASALESWESAVRSACGNDIVIPAEYDLDASPIVIPATRRYIYSFTCLKENDVFCGPVAALTAFFTNPGVSVFNYINELPEGAVKPADCDPCLAARVRLRSGSPYFDGPVVASESIYQSMTSSCGIAGKPASTSTIDYFTSQPEPTESVCDGTMYQIQGGDDCYSISKAQSVGTAWMLSDNHLGAYCSEFPSSGSLCITNTCKTVTVAINTTCSAIATAANITEMQLLAWNPVINPVCSNLNMMNGTTLCIEPPGPKLPPAATTGIPPSTPTAAAPIPSNTAVGSDKPCGRWYEVEPGDYCNMVTLKFAISLPDFLFLNTGINSNCTNLYAAESYCVQAVGDINNYPGRPGHVSFTIDPTASFTGVPFTMLPNATMTPYPRPSPSAPLASGVRDDCVYNFKGDEYQFPAEQLGFWKSNCELAATLYNVDFVNFASWNSLNTSVSDPACAFEVGKRYCGSWALQPKPTGTEAPAPTGTDDGDGKPQPPGPTHSGQPADCDAWHVVAGSDSCQSVADNAGISLDDFYAWNPAVSKDCTTNFWLGQAYCIHREGQGISISSSPATATSSAAPTKPTPPAPTHTGQPADCNKWDVVTDGDSCGSMAADNGITVDQFYAWNPAVSKDCVTNFWLGQAYCVGVSGTGSGITATSPSTKSSTSSSTTVAPTPPAPTHTGQPSDCNKWDVVTDGDSCGSMAADNGITVDQFYAWNPAVSKDCVTNFWLGQAYCVGRSSVTGKPPTTTSSPSTTAKPTPPAPTHTGQPANCNKWDVVGDGDSCGSMASDNGISADQFYAWNPAVSKDCVTNFWTGQAYCVGVSG
ncbi:putative LysM domain-containing protein [Colletotrichum sublineola]|uniref:Putative LysM domain-containing protein n=1 Tax=Colletotrichum sublineola TaxID=1173701 RepID=A0A066XUS1_COLSU|nr:putative LysM domain-containing protein [Colletotrichum sublineola]